MTDNYANRRIGTYTVGLSVACGLAPTCTEKAEASVAATSCEDARQGVMTVLRYRGWQLGKHTEVLCPAHAPKPVKCIRCDMWTPPFYIHPLGDVPFYREAVPELAELARTEPLCRECAKWAREQVFAWHQANRAGRAS